MQLTVSVRDPKTGHVYTHVEVFQGENAVGRALAVLTTMLESWLVRDNGELIVATLVDKTNIPNVAQGD